MSQIMDFKPIEWTASMAIGVDAIDKQHQYLIDTLKEATNKLLGNNDDYLLSQIAKDLLGYAIIHFETEEALMQHSAYTTARPEEAEIHIAEHRNFSSQIVAVRDQLREGQEVSRMEVVRFLNHWLRDHVLGTDQLLGKYLTQISGAKPPH